MTEKITDWIMRSRTAWIRYALAVALSSVALILNWQFHGVTERNLFFLSLATITVAAATSGYGPGILATLLTTFGLDYFFLGAQSSTRLDSEEHLIRIAIFTLTGLVMVFLAGALRAALALAKRAQKTAEQATRDRDEFISIVSHELKTPLTALKLQTQLGLRALTKDSGSNSIDRSTHEKLLRSSSETLNRAERLIDDLLDLSRVSHGKLGIELAPTEADQLINTVISRLSAELERRGLQLNFSLQPNILAAWDPFRIEQVITNLLSNAMKYGGGTPIDVTLKGHRDSAIIIVRDRGPGISQDDQGRLFDRFERAGAARGIKGLGLGLYITKKIVELHRGRIWIESSVGQGASFYVQLPLSLCGYPSAQFQGASGVTSSGVPTSSVNGLRRTELGPTPATKVDDPSA